MSMRLIDAANKLNWTEEQVTNYLRCRNFHVSNDEYEELSTEAELEILEKIGDDNKSKAILDASMKVKNKETSKKSNSSNMQNQVKLGSMRLIDAANKLDWTEEQVTNYLRTRNFYVSNNEYEELSAEAESEILKKLDENNKKAAIEMETPLTADELSYLTGISVAECEHFMDVNHMDGDEAFEAIDIFMQSLNEGVDVPFEIAACMNNAGIYTKMANRLGAYNTMRGGVKGYGGFVFEELHAADAAAKGVNIQVLGNNGIADFIVKDSSGKSVLVQAKSGYKPHQIDWNKYKGQTIVVDRGNVALANEARAAGLKVEYSSIFKKEAEVVARAQQWESRITGSTTAPITATAAGAHYAGMASAKLAARVGVSKKIGENIYDVLAGKKDFADAASDIICDGATIVGSAYISGAAMAAVGTAASALASTSAGVAVTGAVGTAAAAVGSTAVGGAVIAGASTVAAGAASVVAAVASAPLAPVVAVGAAIGAGLKLLKDL